ncbi:hypothetical protein [Sphingobacterium griseoflavum]|uniref:Uncharacterized protein n=1 Tax=Sphingobacterium griseoflavum TaxID=1474952 RepID=A0ABQ3HX81_9SPHI|nr:hypothetical protein [Sphingobacterium griseoflavum]GHE33432.1 hypothetical protein GCM10017764_15680 [Sphingobacterium griseoflavum]
MDIEDLPTIVRKSAILSDSEKLMLATVDTLPDEDEIDQVRALPEIRELLQSFIGDEHTRNTHLQLKASAYLQAQDLQMAWKVLLL